MGPSLASVVVIAGSVFGPGELEQEEHPAGLGQGVADTGELRTGAAGGRLSPLPSDGFNGVHANELV